MSKDNGGPASDRELLKMAAKAAGIDLMWKLGFHQITLPPSVPYFLAGGLDKYWNPLTDDGDALRLAVVLSLDVHVNQRHVEIFSGDLEDCIDQVCVDCDDPCAATRRAIVRAAAAIGSAM